MRGTGSVRGVRPDGPPGLSGACLATHRRPDGALGTGPTPSLNPVMPSLTYSGDPSRSRGVEAGQKTSVDSREETWTRRECQSTRSLSLSGGPPAGVLSGLLKCTAPSRVQQGAVSAENTEATVTEAPTQNPRDREATAVIPAGTGELSVTS